MKHTANFVTCLRIPLAVAMLISVSFSVSFWVFYISCGLTDILDGFLARKLHQESAVGARLDSIADAVFAGCLALYIVINISLPSWIWICLLLIAMLRFLSYGIGYCRFHTFTSLHTYANKITGAMIFLSPVLYSICGLTVAGILLFITSAISALEELAITIKCRELNRDCKGLYFIKNLQSHK